MDVLNDSSVMAAAFTVMFFLCMFFTIVGGVAWGMHLHRTHFPQDYQHAVNDKTKHQ